MGNLPFLLLPQFILLVLRNVCRSVGWMKHVCNSRIAFRIYSTSEKCPSITGTPVLVGGTIVSRTYPLLGGIFPTYQEFNLTLKSDVWTFQSSVFYSCYIGYIPLKRDKYVMCMNIIQTETCINRTQAVAGCAEFNSIGLMGIANLEESSYIRNVAMGLISKQSSNKTYTSLGFWMDGIRKPTCKYPQPKSASCNGTNEFNYNDISAPNPTFHWAPRQPDGLLNNPPDSNCLYLKVDQNGNSGVDDAPCSSSENVTANVCMKGYLCGIYAAENYIT
ncbi:hypothetical protein L3Y34_007396 [Caenorhabditis briggsae]|uniref:C-type lectin domain-containing protein n=1 Tax=Caenorhabditis briggsae TaxID=6238 RepID=A0AAE9D027_CAEBR|nr:hypothetical protein L3Y34_007396 [Caenorhabditis briggsae]